MLKNANRLFFIGIICIAAVLIITKVFVFSESRVIDKNPERSKENIVEISEDNKDLFEEKEDTAEISDMDTPAVEITSWDVEYNGEGRYLLNVDYLNSQGDAAGTDIVMTDKGPYRRINFKINKSFYPEEKIAGIKFSKILHVPEKNSAEAKELPLNFFGNAVYKGSDGKKADAENLIVGEGYYIYVPLADIETGSAIKAETGNKQATYITFNSVRWFDLG